MNVRFLEAVAALTVTALLLFLVWLLAGLIGWHIGFALCVGGAIYALVGVVQACR